MAPMLLAALVPLQTVISSLKYNHASGYFYNVSAPAMQKASAGAGQSFSPSAAAQLLGTCCVSQCGYQGGDNLRMYTEMLPSCSEPQHGHCLRIVIAAPGF
jgi:hypothetical protein